MNESKHVTQSTWQDPDDAPELTDEWFERADQYEGGTLIRRGRPLDPNRKQSISLRLDGDVVERFKADGPGWQSRMNAALRKAVGL
jgi:uncharacterized protein (DUF4415 family)